MGPASLSRVNRPSYMIYGGSIYPGECNGNNIDIVDAFQSYGKYMNNEMVVADIPGLIEGAHEGKGLGDRFLGHIERCSLLLHLIDANDENINKSWETVRKEIKSYSKELNLKSEIIALSKSDTLSDAEMNDKIKDLRNFTGKEVYKISSISGDGVDKILKIMNEKVSEDLPDETIEGWKP